MADIIDFDCSNGPTINGRPIKFQQTDGSNSYLLDNESGIAIEVPMEYIDWIPLTFDDGIERLCYMPKYEEIDEKWSIYYGLEGLMIPDNWRELPNWCAYFRAVEEEFLSQTEYWKL